MKFLSLFTKVPDHQRFNYMPRYYDPKKEEMQERVDRIRQEIERERGIVKEADTTDYRKRMSGAFQASRRRSKASPDLQTPMLRLGILLFMAIFLIAYLTWGKPVLYSLIAVVPVYFYLKLKVLKRNS